MHERPHHPCPRHNPHQCLLLHKGSSTSHHEPNSSQTSPSANEDCRRLGVARPNEDSVAYAAKIAREGVGRGKSRIPRWPSETYILKLTSYAVSSLPLSSFIGTTTHPNYHKSGYARDIQTLVPLKSCAFRFANKESLIPSILFAATAASEIDVGSHSSTALEQPSQSSPPLCPIQPAANKQADVERSDREELARKLRDYLEAHPEPIVGSIDSPFPFADKYGIKGLSILSAFFDHLDMESFTCHFCNDKRITIDDALVHQRTARHYHSSDE